MRRAVQWQYQTINASDFKNLAGVESARVFTGNDFQTICFEPVRVGYGIRYYFQCPECCRKCCIMYLSGDEYLCRECAGARPYYQIQYSTKYGADYLLYKMRRFADSNGIGKLKYPVRYWDYPKLKYKRNDKWLKNLAILQALANMYFQSLILGVIWDYDTIRSVERGSNRLLSNRLCDLESRIYRFELGVNSPRRAGRPYQRHDGLYKRF